MKNVCFYNSIKFWGGGEKLMLDHAIHFQKKGYNTYIASHKKSELKKRSISYKCKKHFNTGTISSISFLNIVKVFKFCLFVKKHKIETLIATASQDVKMIAIAGKILGIPRIVYFRGLAMPIKKKYFNTLVLKYWTTHIVANTEATKQMILLYYKGVFPQEKIKVIHHGINIKPFVQEVKPLRDITSKAKGIVIGNIGRLEIQKGHKYLIELTEELKKRGIDVTTFIGGIGLLEKRLRKEIQNKGLDKEVILSGFIEDIPGFLASIDVFVLTSLWEGFSFVLAEAMASKKPIVAFDISSNPEVVVNNETGFLVPPKNIQKLADKIVLFVENPKLKKNMGEKGLQHVKEKFLIDDRITQFEYYIST